MQLEQSVQEFYENHGAAFSKTRGATWPVMRLVSAELRPGMTLVDVGAGNGRLARELAAGVNYIGIEPSSTLRAAAEELLRDCPGTRMLSGALPCLPLKDGVADVVACIAVLHHLTRDEREVAVHELARILKPGGTLVLTVWNLRSLRMRSWKTWLAAWCRLPLVYGGGFGDTWVRWPAHGAWARRYVHAFTLRELRSLCDSNVWEIERAEAWGNQGQESIWRAGNLVVVARRRI